MNEEAPEHVGLLGWTAGERGPLDPLAQVGLGLGATERAKHLVRLGLVMEMLAELHASNRRPRGAPRKSTSKDLRRVSHLAWLMDTSFGRRIGQFRSIADLVRVAQQIELLEVQAGLLPPSSRLFNLNEETLLPSVTRGLRALGVSGEEFLRRNPVELFAKDEEA